MTALLYRLLCVLVLVACTGPVTSPTPRESGPTRRPSPTSRITPAPTPSPTPTPSPSPTPEPLFGTLAFATLSDRHVPADGIATATVVATVTDADGKPVGDRRVELRPIGVGVAAVSPPAQVTTAAGRATFEVASGRSGPSSVGLFVPRIESAVARLTIDFTRKVIVLAPGFQSALAQRFQIFGAPSECEEPDQPGSITEALICLGYTANAADDPLVRVPTPGATVLDMSWEATLCRPTDAADDKNCVATISRSPDGTDVVWQPANYDLGDWAAGMARQWTVDSWARRLVDTLRIYDAELFAARGMHASFYLVGHSLGGEVALRAMRTILADPELALSYAGDQRGRLQLVLSVDGALNWTGGVQLGSATACQIPLHTTADLDRERDNVDAVEQAYDRFGTETIAITTLSDPVVGPEVALLNSPAVPSRGYTEAIFETSADCGHSSLLSPEPGPPVSYPLNDLFIERIGVAAGE